MERYTVRQGTDLLLTVTLCDEQGEPITGVYTGTEPLGLVLWVGGTRRAVTLATSSVAWLDSAAGTVTLQLDQADTAALPVGFYDLTVTLTDGADVLDAYEATLDVSPTPGSDAEPRTYVSFGQIRDALPWIAQVVFDDPHMPNNLEPQRVAAREWFDDLLHRHYRWSGYLPLGSAPRIVLAVGMRRSGRRNPWLTEILDAKALIVTGPIMRANAFYAASEALRHCLGSRGDTPYQDLAARYRAEAEEIASQITAELDADGDGIGDLVIDLSAIDTLRS